MRAREIDKCEKTVVIKNKESANGFSLEYENALVKKKILLPVVP